MMGETRILSVSPEEPSIHHIEQETTEEVVATIQTGDEEGFIVAETSSEEVMDSIVEEEIVAEEEIPDVPLTDNPTQVNHVLMETDDIPDNVIVTNDAISEDVTNHNIPKEEATLEHINEETIVETVNHIPDEISEEVTESVHNHEHEQSRPDDNSTQVFQAEEEEEMHESPPPYSSSSILKSVVESTITTRTTLGSTTIGDTVVPTLLTTITSSHPNTSHHLSQIPKPPLTDILLQTAREVLQLPEEPGDVKSFLMQQEPGLRLSQMAGPVVTETVISSGHQGGSIETMATSQRLSLEEENSQHMEVSDENATYILEPVTNEEYYQDDQNIMWIQETVEVEQESYDSLPNMVIILNPNGTVNEELMLAHGMNLETIKAVTDNVVNLQSDVAQQQQGDLSLSIKSLQYPIPRRDLIDVKPLFTNQAPRTVVDSVLTDSKQGLRSIVEGSLPVTTEHSRSVILDAKDNFLVLDELEGQGVHGRDPMIEPLELSQLGQATHKIININGTNHIVANSRTIPDLKRTYLPSNQLKDQNGQDMQFNVSNLSNLSLPMTPLGTLDLSLPKKPDPSIMEQYVNPAALVSENSVLKALSGQQLLGTKDSIAGKLLRPPGKVRKPKARDENGNGTPYIHRKTTSLGALGQALHGSMLGIPRDSRENAVQICPICKFQATTKNPYRHLQDHLARNHFKDRIAAELPTKKPYICPMAGCDGKHYPDWQAVMRHYIGKKHGILDKFVKETLSEGLQAGMLL